MDAESLILGLKADDGGFGSQMDHAGDAVDRFGHRTKDAETKGGSFFSKIVSGGAGLAGMVPGIGTVAGVVMGLGGKLFESAKAADEEQVGMNRLYTTMKNSIGGWNGNTDAVEAYIGKQQNLAFADDQLRDSLNVLVGETHNLKQAQDLQGTAMDLARAKNIDLQTATKLVGKVDMDNIATLKKLGIAVTDHMTKEQALAAIREQTSGQAQAYANTAAGGMERLQTIFGNVLESVGHTILPKITDALGGLANFMNSDSFQGAITMAINLVGAGFDFLGKAIDVVTQFLSPLIPPVQQFVAAIAAGGDPLQAFGNLLGQVGPILADLSGKVLQMVGNALPGILSKLGEWGMAFISWVGPQIPPLLSKLGQLLGQVGGWLMNTGLPTLLSKLAEWGGAFIAWVGPKIPPLLSKLGQLLGQVGGWLMNTGLPTLLSKLAEWGGAFIGWVGPKILPLLGKLGELLLQVGGWIITTALPAIIGKLVEWGGAFIGFVAKDVLPKLPGVLGNIASGIWNWITQTARDIAQKVLAIGGGLIDGIKQGVANAWNGLVNWLSSKIKDALPDFIKNWLGIHSPSTVTQDVGVNLMKGMQQGVSDGTADMLGTWRATFGAMGIVAMKQMDKDTQYSVAWWFDTSLDKMFQHLHGAWGPQTKEDFKHWFDVYTGFFQTYTDRWVQIWQDAMNSLTPPSVPTAPPQSQSYVPPGSITRGRGPTPTGGSASQSQGAPYVIFMDGKPISQGLARRSNNRQPLPSVRSVVFTA